MLDAITYGQDCTGDDSKQVQDDNWRTDQDMDKPCGKNLKRIIREI